MAERTDTVPATDRRRQAFTQTHKHCPDCGETKPLDDFSPNAATSSGRATYCRPCQNVRAQRSYRRRTPEQIARQQERERRGKVMKAYGLTAEQYEVLDFEAGCHVCGGQPGGRWKRRLHIDHDHTTGRIRGLLCHHCNTAIGLANDDPTRLRALADYLERG